MNKIVGVLSPATSFFSTVIAFAITMRAVVYLFETYGHGTDYLVNGVIAFAVGSVVLSGLAIGLLHGWTYGRSFTTRISTASGAAALAFSVFLFLATIYYGIFALPFVLPYALLVMLGVRIGAKLPGACTYVSGKNGHV
jgi:hypothetical protein